MSSLTTRDGRAAAKSRAGWQPKHCCSKAANTWSRLSNILFISYVSGYHQASSASCVMTLAARVTRHGTRR